MGATADLQLSMNFLEASLRVWSRAPGFHQTRESIDSLVSALAYTTILYVAGAARDAEDDGDHKGEPFVGRLFDRDGGEQELSAQDGLHKIIHGVLKGVHVENGKVALHVANNERDMKRSGREGRWSLVEIDAERLIDVVSKRLFKHRTQEAQQREDMIFAWLVQLNGSSELRRQPE
jgi:hypothetical protein